MAATDSQTIAAIATAPGLGGVGIVRISGESLQDFARALCGRTPAARSATRAVFRDSAGDAIDDGIVLYFPAPASYTGEDVLELQGHGGPVVQHMLLHRCVELGARLAQPGEFTRRAFLNGKLDLAQAEAVADIIEAATETAARCALRSLRGQFSAAIQELVDQLVELRALVEATLDFPEEEIDVEDRIDAGRRLDHLEENLAQVLNRSRQGSILRAGLQVVLAGQPNVGKSSLLNQLAGEDLAIVTDVPGTTRDTVRQTVQIDGVPISIIDTAGLRDTVDAVESLGIARTWHAIERADVLLLVVDAARGVTDSDLAILNRIPGKLTRVLVFNKIDLLPEAPRAAEEDGEWRVLLSARTGEGVGLLRQVLLSLAGWRVSGEDAFMARERHISALVRASEALIRARVTIGRGELFAEELRLAQKELNSITGEFTADDLLGEIFSRFCIGK